MHKYTKRDKLGMVLFLAPAIILFLAYFVYPVLFLLATSFTKWDGLSSPEFIGIKNYIKLFNDKVFIRSMINNVGWVFAGGFIQVPLATLVAIMLATKPKGWKILRTTYYLPNVISIVAMSMMWMAVFNSEYGLLNAFLRMVGLGHLEANWLGNLHTAYPAIVLFGVGYIGYFMIIILAETQTIPGSLYEAASIEGATRFQQDRHITLPLVKGSISTCMTIAMVYGLRQFEQTYIMTNGGPANRTTVIVVYLFKKIRNLDFGLANASGMILLVIGVIVIISVRKFMKVEKYEY